jgi:hypothetical protein
MILFTTFAASAGRSAKAKMLAKKDSANVMQPATVTATSCPSLARVLFFLTF